MKIYIRLTSSLVFLLSTVTFQANANIAYSCGLKPLPRVGCVIGDCVNGVWQQVCSIKKQESQGYSDSLLNNIANPKMADIAGAIEAREAREAQQDRESHWQSDKPNKKTTEDIYSSSLAAFEEIANTNMDVALLIMRSYGSAFKSANETLKTRKKNPYFVQQWY